MVASSDAEMRYIATDLAFPEGPVALECGDILVGEMAAGRITRIAPDGRKSVVAETGGGPNGLALGPDGKLYVCNNGGQSWGRENGRLIALGQSDRYSGGRIERIDLSSGAVEVLYDRSPGGPLRGPNDIVFDRFGGFWFTDMGKRRARDMDRGGVYYATPDGRSIREVVYPMIQPNGIALSPDETRLYVAETSTARVWAFDLKGPGEIEPTQLARREESQLLLGLPGYRHFDSMAVDAAGNVCVATLIGGLITVISPEGRLLEQVAMPDDQTTNICFGGPDHRTAYITLSGIGAIMARKWPRPGARLNFSESAQPDAGQRRA